MELWHQLFLVALLLPFVSCATPAYVNCQKNFTTDNVLQGNINKALSDLLQNTSAGGNAVSIAGSDTSIVYLVSSCRSDIGIPLCSTCISAAAQELQDLCPNSAASRIWYQYCSIRYDTINFFGAMDISDTHIWFATRMIDDHTFFTAVLRVLSWVKVTAASYSNKFGMGQASLYSSNTTIFATAQCTVDHQEEQCIECLEAITTIVAGSCTNHAGCFVMSSSCALRYEIYNFLQVSSIPSYPGDVAAPAPAPSKLA